MEQVRDLNMEADNM